MASTLTPGIRTITPTTPGIETILDGIVHIHASCILQDGTMATFLPPLDHTTMYQWWEDRLKEVEQGSRHIIICLSEVSSRRSAPGPPEAINPPFERAWPTIKPADHHALAPASASASAFATATTETDSAELEVSGVVSLATPFSQTGPFRGLVQKLFASPLHRRKGIARALMAELEAVAWENGRWNLMLDTTVGTDAELVYPRLGYTVLGVVTEYGISPKDRTLKDEIWFWKDLRKTRLNQG